MPDESGQFQTIGPTWGERAALGELNAVLSPTGSKRRNLFLHGTSMFAARLLLRLSLDRAIFWTSVVGMADSFDISEEGVAALPALK